nr:hypothetical protein [Tanacetum cinerariifolium]
SYSKTGRQIVMGHRSSPNKSSVVLEKAKTPRSCLRWISMGRIFNTVGLSACTLNLTTVTPHYLPKVREYVLAKPHHVIAPGSSRNSSKESYSLGPGLHVMTLVTPSTGLVSNHVSQEPCVPPNRDDWDRLFKPMFNEYFNPPTIDVSPVQEAAAPRAKVLPNSLVSISISHDA